MALMNWQENINCIKEISPGRFQIILDFATVKVLPFLIRDDYPFVWVHDHKPSGPSWEKASLPIHKSLKNHDVLARNISFDFVVPTNEFLTMLPDWQGGITLVQANKIPPYYLDLTRIKGNIRYEMLARECDYLFEVDIPSATDYGTLISRDRVYLQSLLDNPEIDWKDLP